MSHHTSCPAAVKCFPLPFINEMTELKLNIQFRNQLIQHQPPAPVVFTRCNNCGATQPPTWPLPPTRASPPHSSCVTFKMPMPSCFPAERVASEVQARSNPLRTPAANVACAFVHHCFSLSPRLPLGGLYRKFRCGHTDFKTKMRMRMTGGFTGGYTLLLQNTGSGNSSCPSPHALTRDPAANHAVEPRQAPMAATNGGNTQPSSAPHVAESTVACVCWRVRCKCWHPSANTQYNSPRSDRADYVQ